MQAIFFFLSKFAVGEQEAEGVTRADASFISTAVAAQAIFFSATSPSLLIPLSSPSSARPFHFALVGQPLRPSFSSKLAVAPKPLVVAASSKKAVAVLKGSSTVEGIVTLVQEENGPTTVKVRVTGLAPGLHGFHLHEYGDTTNGCISTVAHFNPNKMTHGAPEDEVRHAGDLGNIVANSEGVAEATIVDNQIPLSGPNSEGPLWFMNSRMILEKVAMNSALLRDMLEEDWHVDLISNLLYHEMDAVSMQQSA